MVEESISIPCDGLFLEGRVSGERAPASIVVLCHPHPAFGGSMDVPLVLALRDALGAAGAATLRFNFRGVGESRGRGTGGAVEPRDVCAAIEYARGRAKEVSLAGYSFGAAMALAALADGAAVTRVCAIAPPTEMGLVPEVQFGAALARGIPVHLIAGTDDPICRIPALRALAGGRPHVEVIALAGIAHVPGGSDEQRVVRAASRFFASP